MLAGKCSIASDHPNHAFWYQVPRMCFKVYLVSGFNVITMQDRLQLILLLFALDLTVMLNGRTIASGGDVIITDIGKGDKALVCMTDLADCCNVQNNKRGEWKFPDGTLVGTDGGGGDIYRNRGTKLVLLNRRNNALGPLGSYCCEVDTSMICINSESILCIK